MHIVIRGRNKACKDVYTGYLQNPSISHTPKRHWAEIGFQRKYTDLLVQLVRGQNRVREVSASGML